MDHDELVKFAVWAMRECDEIDTAPLEEAQERLQALWVRLDRFGDTVPIDVQRRVLVDAERMLG